jgi:hypothetical protein
VEFPGALLPTLGVGVPEVTEGEGAALAAGAVPGGGAAYAPGDGT